MKYLLMAHLAATLFMVSMIRFVQVVHYTLFEKVGEEKFAFYAEAHSRRSSSSSTALLQVPRHNTSGSGFDEGDYKGLVLSNRVCTAAPTRGGLVLS